MPLREIFFVAAYCPYFFGCARIDFFIQKPQAASKANHSCTGYFPRQYFLYYNDTKKFVEGNYDISALLPVAMPIFFFLAAQGISRDQKLVKSVDRLR